MEGGHRLFAGVCTVRHKGRLALRDLYGDPSGLWLQWFADLSRNCKRQSVLSDEHVAPLRRQAGISGINAESGEKFFQNCNKQ